MTVVHSRIGEARARLLRLFARVVADGLHPALRAEIAGLDELAEFVDVGRDPDDEAADHQDLFGHRVPPYAGVFLDPECRIGGRPADDAQQAYAGSGWNRGRPDLGPDHLATHLDFLAHCAARGLDEAARSFLDDQVHSWLAAFTAPVAREPYPAYRGLLSVLEEVLREYRSSLGEPVAPREARAIPGDLLSDPRTGVREIASYLGAPARSGLWLGRGDVERLGRETGVPRGFGGRVLMLGNLLRGAAEYDQAGPVLKAIDRIATDTASHWERAGGPWTAIWTNRIDRTRNMLAEMEGRIREEADQGSGS